jgi:hypothetical protein
MYVPIYHVRIPAPEMQQPGRVAMVHIRDPSREECVLEEWPISYSVLESVSNTRVKSGPLAWYGVLVELDG